MPENGCHKSNLCMYRKLSNRPRKIATIDIIAAFSCQCDWELAVCVPLSLSLYLCQELCLKSCQFSSGGVFHPSVFVSDLFFFFSARPSLIALSVEWLHLHPPLCFASLRCLPACPLLSPHHCDHECRRRCRRLADDAGCTTARLVRSRWRADHIGSATTRADVC